MPVTISHQPGAPEAEVVEAMRRDGFEAATKDYSPGKTEPHHHDYDVCLHVLDGEFKLKEVERSIVHRFGPGDRILVDRGTVHAEEHGSLRMIVGRRH